MLAEYPQIVEFLPILAVNRSGEIVFWNEAAQELYGYSREQSIGQASDVLLQTEYPCPIADIHQSLAETGHWRGELRQKHRDGNEIFVTSWWSVHHEALESDDSIFQINHDITEQKQVAEFLRDNEATLRGFFDSNAVRMCVMELHGDDLVYIRPNQAFADFFKLPVSQVKGRSGRELGLSGSTIQWWADRCRECSQTGQPLTLEYSLQQENRAGEQWYLGTISPIPTDPSKFPRFALTSYGINDRKRAEQALRESEEKLRTIFNSTYDSIIIHTVDGTILDANETAARVHGVSRDQLLNHRLQDTFKDPGCEADARALWEKVISGQPQFFEWRGRRLSDASPRDCEIYLRPFMQGNQTCILANIRDVTERKQAEAAVQRANREIATLLESITDAFVAWDRDWRYIYINGPAEHTLGRRREALLGRDMREVFPYIVSTDYYKLYERAMNERVTITMEYATPDGNWLEVHAYPAPTGGLSVFFRDITQSKQAEAALRESEKRFKAIFDTAAVGIGLAAPDGHWIGVNKRLSELLGYTQEELRTKTFQDLTCPEDLTSNLVEIHRLLAGEIASFSVEKRYVRKDASLLWADVTVSLKRNEDGSPDYFIAMVHDISERKQTQAALARAQEELLRYSQRLEEHVAERTARLTAAVEELEAFSYSIAHDLRAPLRGIHGFGTILQREYGNKLDPEADQLISMMNTSAERMDHLIRDILNYSKIVRGKMELSAIDTDRLVRDIVQSYPNLRSEKADIEIRSPLPFVLGNLAALTQCVSNLLENAVKFVAPGVRPRIQIWAEPTEDRARILIRDNGIGIPENGSERIFRIFQRLHTESEYEGTGIGLAIVRRSVERMSGTVGFKSEVGKGSTFWIELKQAQPESDPCNEPAHHLEDHRIPSR